MLQQHETHRVHAIKVLDNELACNMHPSCMSCLTYVSKAIHPEYVIIGIMAF